MPGLEGWTAGLWTHLVPGPHPWLLRSLQLGLLTAVVLLFAAEGDSSASWHLRCCHGNSRGARQPLLLRQQAELQSQVLSSPAPRTRPQVPSSWVGPPQPSPPLPPHQVLALRSPPTCTGSLSHPGEPCPFWAGPPASCWPPGRAPGPQALLGQTLHLPSCDTQTRVKSRAEQGGVEMLQ